MHVLAISDLHGRLPDIPDCDLLVIGGDICPDHPIGKRDRYMLSDKGPAWQANWLRYVFRGWLDGLRERGVEIVAIWGNHDFVGEHPWLVPRLPWTLLQDSETCVGGLRIYGTPWVPGLPDWAFYGSEEAQRARAEAIPQGLDILITHGPPYGTADVVFGSINVGDPAMRDAIVRARPCVTICGHIHEGFGAYDVEGNTLYNVSHVDENYSSDVRAATVLHEFA